MPNITASNAEPQHMEMSKLYQQSSFSEDEKKFQNTFDNYPVNKEMHKEIAQGSLQKICHEDAYLQYTSLTTDHPDIPDGYIGVGNVLLQQGLFNEAEEILQKAVSLFPNSQEAKERYAYVALQRLDVDEAYSRYTFLQAKHPDYPAGYIGMGNALLQQNLFSKAEEVFKDACARFPSNQEAQERYAYTALQQLNLDEAYSRYTVLKNRHPDNPDGYIGVGNVQIQRKLFLQAEKIYKYAVIKFNYSYYILKALIVAHHKNIRCDIHIICPSFTNLALSSYAHIKTKFPQETCFDEGKHLYAALVAAKAISTHIRRTSPSYSKASPEPNKKTIAIVGDSHIVPTFFNLKKFHSLGFTPKILSFPGASISGLGKMNSTLQILPRIKTYITGARIKHLVLKLGQVDLDFGYYYKKYIKKEHSMTLSEFSKTLTDQYIEVAQTLMEITDVTICSINLPSMFCRQRFALRVLSLITESANNKKMLLPIYKKLEALQPSILCRTNATIEFNAILNRECIKHNIHFFDTTEIFLDKRTGLLKALHQSDNDHHYVMTDNDKALVIDLLLKNT